MDYRLGLDLGTNSIGAVALSLDSNGQPKDIVWHRAHIFSEPLDNKKGTLTPKAQDRRLARQRRRQLQRRNRRVKKVALLAPLLGLNKDEIYPKDQSATLKNGVKVPYLAYIRAKAVEEYIELGDLLRVFLRITKKRGYNGGFKVKSADKDKGKVEAGATLLNEKLHNQTLGQYLLQRLSNGLPTRLKIHQYYDNQDDLYALREHLQAEFHAIWNKQVEYHSILKAHAFCPFQHQNRPIKDIFFQVIFEQRPLKPVADKVGRCELEPTLPRAPRAQMAAQAFRIEKTLADLQFGQGKNSTSLAPKQKTIIRELLDKQAEVSFKTIYKALDKANCLPKGKKFSIDRTHKESLKGNTTLAGFKTLKLLDDWLALDETTQIQVINFWSELGSPEQLDDPNWHQSFLTHSSYGKPKNQQKKREFSRQLIDFMNKLLDTGKFDRLSKVNHFEGGRAAYSIKALCKLTDYMHQNDCNETESIKFCYPDRREFTVNNEERFQPPISTGNAVVDVALRQLHKVIADCMDNLGNAPKQIIVEMTRDIKNSVKSRNEIESKNKKQANNKKRIAGELQKLNAAGTPANILKYELWEEQDSCCPYCNEKISAQQVTDGSQTNFEHIIPQSKSKVGRKRSEIILAHRECNREKNNRLPLLAFAGDPQRIAAIEEMAKRLEKKKQKRKAQLLRLDDEQGLLGDESVSGFSDWQKHDTSWIAKLAAQWLRCLSQDISVTRGGLTNILRKNLGLETVIPQIRYEEGLSVFTKDGVILSEEDFRAYQNYYEGHTWNGDPQKFPPLLDKRIDHRHHLIDAFVIALSERKFVQNATNRYQRLCDESRRQHGKINYRIVMQNMRKSLGNSLEYLKVREKALDMIRSAYLTHRPDRYITGRFYQDGAYQRVIDEERDRLRLVIRKPLLNLATKGNINDTRNKINTIVSQSVREHVLAVFEERIKHGKTPEQALSEPVIQQWYGVPKPITRVKTYYDMSAEKAEKIEFGGQRQHGHKYLIPDLYAYCKVLLDSEGKVDTNRSQLVTLANAMAKPIALEPNEWRYYKGDTVIDQKTGRRLLIHKFKAISGGTLFMAPLTETRTVDDIKSNEGKISVSLSKLNRYKPEATLQ